MTDLRTAALRALEAWQDQKGMKLLCEAMDDLGEALAQPEDKSQAAFEHWVETVEATQGCAISRNAVVDKLLTVTAAQMVHADATCKQSLQVEPCNKSCAPGYCYCEPIIKPEIKGHNVEPPPEAQTEAEKIAYCAGWWAAMEQKREQQEPVACIRTWHKGSNQHAELLDWTDALEALPDGEHWLYTHPPRRAWRGLTDSERAAVQYQSFKRGLSPLEFMELHEAKLKELNHD
jgi:hypothetical protein